MKLSMNLIKRLEKMGTWAAFRDEYDAIYQKDKSYANTFAGLLEVCNGLNTENADYLILGGMSVASYLNQFQNTAFRDWRGSNDIDLLCPEKGQAEGVLLDAGYRYMQSRQGLPGAVGRVFDYAKNDNGESTLVGLRQGVSDGSDRDITRSLLNNKAIIPVYGIQIPVPRLKHLVEMKRQANRAKDRVDIKSLKGILNRA